MQNRIATRKVKRRKPVVDIAEVKTVIERFLQLLPRHGVEFSAGIAGKNVAVSASLIAFVSNMPLERKILFHVRPLRAAFFLYENA